MPRRPSVEEASRHAGFDARLCYGDVLLSFRYFPSGLPPEANLGSEFLARFNSNVCFLFFKCFYIFISIATFYRHVFFNLLATSKITLHHA